MSNHFPSNLYGWSPFPSPHKCVAQERWYTVGFRLSIAIVGNAVSHAAAEVPAEFREFYRLGFRDGGWRAKENGR